jgi:hypothetical protein
LVFTARRDPVTRLNDYKQALTRWLGHPESQSVIFVENSGSDLSELRSIADEYPEKAVEFLSFQAPEFDGSLGKGHGEMLCLQYAVEHSRLLPQSRHFLKVTGRYYLANATQLLRFAESRPDVEIFCDMLLNLTFADSRAFVGTTGFLRDYLFPLAGEVNDSRRSNFEHVLARAVHSCMANNGLWAQPPLALEIQGFSGSEDRNWLLSLRQRLKLRIRQNLFARALATGPK